MQCREDKPFCSGLYFQRLQFGERQIQTEKLQVSKFYYPAVKKSENECNMSDLCKFAHSYRCVPGFEVDTHPVVNFKERLATTLATDLHDSELGCTSWPHTPSLMNKCDIQIFLPCQFIKKVGLDKVLMYLFWRARASLCSGPRVLFNYQLFWHEIKQGSAYKDSFKGLNIL